MSDQSEEKKEAPAGQHKPAIASQEQAAKHKRPYAYNVWLPSGGHLYDGKFPGGEIVLAPLGVRQEKVMSQQTRDRMGLLDTILKQCILDIPIPYEELLLPDWFYAFLMLRNISYGPVYKFTLECQGCQTNFAHQISLPESLSLRCLSEEDEGSEPWRVPLPIAEKSVSLRRLRVRDETEIRRYTRNQYARSVNPNEGDPAYIYRLAKCMTAINGEDVNQIAAMNFVEGLHVRDSHAIRDSLREKDFGATLKVDTDCPACGAEVSRRLPMDADFFRPGDRESAA